MIALFCDAAIEGRVPTVFGDGGQTRDFVYVGDVVEAFAAAGESRVGGFANVATGTETTVLDLARALGLASVSAPERPGEVRRSCLAPGLAAELLGWHAAHDAGRRAGGDAHQHGSRNASSSRRLNIAM